MRAIRLLLVAAAFTAGLYFVAWWTVPIIGALYALIRRNRAAPSEAMIGALVASLLLLVPSMTLPAFGTLLEQLGKIFPMPGIGVLGLTLMLFTVLAYTSARVMTGATGTREIR